MEKEKGQELQQITLSEICIT